MQATALRQATLAYGADGVPYNADYDDVYHPRAGAFAQARHVFLGGNGLPERWAGRERFVVLETGFGLGNNFLATWEAWRQDSRRCDRLHFISIEKHPLARDDLARAHAASPLPERARELIEAWPVLTPNLHRLSFDNARVQLLLALGDVTDWLPEVVAQVDAFYLDGFAPAKNPQMWDARLLKAIGRLAVRGSTVATWSVAREVQEGLRSAGFQVEKRPGLEGKREMTVARFEPHFTPRRAPARSRAASSDHARHAVIVGAGLAGCATAHALAEQGWTSTLLDQRSAPAQQSSGNPAGLFHGIVNAQEGAHARFNRAAALQTEAVVRAAIARHGVAGQVEGLLRLQSMPADAASMARTLDRLGLPLDYVQALDAAKASAIAGVPLAHPAWWFPGGGWVSPAALASAFVEQCAGAVVFRGGIEVATLRQSKSGWQLYDAQGHLIEECPVLVLANARECLPLLARSLVDPAGHLRWPLQSIRGQITTLAATARGLHAPRVPVVDAGYVLPAYDGVVTCGATRQIDDLAPLLSDADHQTNLATLMRLTGSQVAPLPSELGGRVGWRSVANDRLPVIGAVADGGVLARAGLRLDQARLVPRHVGLYVHTALASRGITWASLGAQTLAALISGAPCPLEASLLDAVDVGRFVARAARSGSLKTSSS